MIVRNEERFLARCLESVAGIVDEMVIVDTGSTDRTIEIAQSAGAKVSSLPWPGSFAAARNEGLRAASCEWVLVLDADEHLEPDAAIYIRALTDQAPPGPVQYALKIVNAISEGEFVEHSTVRLFRREGVTYVGAIHEQPVCDSHGLSVICPRPIIFHDGYREDVVVELKKNERNLALLKSEIDRQPQNAFNFHNLMITLRAAGDDFGALQAGIQCLLLLHHQNALDVIYASHTFNCVVSAMVALGELKCAHDLSRSKLAFVAHDSSAYWFQHGQICMSLGHYPAAIQAFECASIIGAENSPGVSDPVCYTWGPYWGIARAHLAMGQIEAALVYLERGAQLFPKCQQITELLARVYSRFTNREV